MRLMNTHNLQFREFPGEVNVRYECRDRCGSPRKRTRALDEEQLEPTTIAPLDPDDPALDSDSGVDIGFLAIGRCRTIDREVTKNGTRKEKRRKSTGYTSFAPIINQDLTRLPRPQL